MLPKSTQFWTRTVVLLLALCLAFYILPLATPFVLSFVVTLILWPMVDFIEKMGKRYMPRHFMPRWLAIIPAFIIFGCVITFILNYVLVPFIDQLTGFINNAPELMTRFMEVFTYIQMRYFNTDLPPQLLNIINNSAIRLGNYGMILAQKAGLAILSVASFLVELLLVPIITFYMLKDGKKLMTSFTNIFEGSARLRVKSLLSQMYTTLAGYIRGELFLAVDMFVIVFIAMTLFGVPYPLLLALLAGFAEWIPIIGPIMGAVPAIILASLIDLRLAVNVALFYFCIQLFDGQVTMPKVFGRCIKLHPVIIIAVIFVGGTLYGIKGMMLAVPVTAILQIIAKELWYYNSTLKGKDNHYENN